MKKISQSSSGATSQDMPLLTELVDVLADGLQRCRAYGAESGDVDCGFQRTTHDWLGGFFNAKTHRRKEWWPPAKTFSSPRLGEKAKQAAVLVLVY